MTSHYFSVGEKLFCYYYESFSFIATLSSLNMNFHHYRGWQRRDNNRLLDGNTRTDTEKIQGVRIVPYDIRVLKFTRVYEMNGRIYVQMDN